MPLDNYELATLEGMLKCVASGYAEREYVDNAMERLRKHNKENPIQKIELPKTDLSSALRMLTSKKAEVLENKIRKKLARLLTGTLYNNLVICAEDCDRAEKIILEKLQQIKLEDLTND